VTALAKTPLRRAGALALLIAAALAVATTVVVAAVLIVQSRSEATEAELTRLARYEAAIAARPALEKELALLRQDEAKVPGLLGGENAAVAAARLQSQVRALIEHNGGEVRSTQDLPPTRRPGFEQINVVCEFLLPMSRLKETLHQVDSETPYLFVDSATIQGDDEGGGSAQAANPKLAMRWTIHGYRSAGAR